MSSARLRKKKSRSGVKLFPLYKHPQDAPPQKNSPTMPMRCRGIFLRGLGALPSRSILRMCYDAALLAGSKTSVKRGKRLELHSCASSCLDSLFTTLKSRVCRLLILFTLLYCIVPFASRI